MISNELRIGNYLQDFGGNVAQVIHLTKDKTILESPIPLTEEWLLKFGFIQKKTKGRGFYLNDILLRLENDKYETILIADDPFCGHLVEQEIKYVHQLQNLYFALTGNELEIK
jgi:hypothetical protein